MGLLRRRDRAARYGERYFGIGRNPTDRQGHSGYERYERDNSHARDAAFVLWRRFPTCRVFEVGAAKGYVVEALRELGYDASGADISGFAVAQAPPGVRPHLRQGDLLRRAHTRRWPPSELVVALETLEHLPPGDVPRALSTLRRLTTAWVVVTIPCFGPNPNGVDGWFDGKVRWDRLEHYKSLGPGYRGPVPEHDLLRDEAGEPIEGHLTIASYDWWTERFAEAGLERCGPLERQMNDDIEWLGLLAAWDLLVFRVPGTPDLPPPRGEEESAALVARWGLDWRDPRDREW